MSARRLIWSGGHGRAAAQGRVAALHRLLIALVAAVSCLLAAESSPAQAPHDGLGFGIADSDDYVAEAMGYRFAAVAPKTFRFIVPYNAVEDLVAISRTAERLARARAAGVEQIAVSFGARGGDSPELGFHRPSVSEWIGLVRQFIDRFDAEVDVWGPANEPNAGVGWLAGAHGDGPRKLAGYFRALESELELRGGHDLLMSPEFHDDYDGQALDRRETHALHGASDPRSDLHHYLDHYRAALGGFGDFIGWHPYSGVRRLSLESTEDLLASTSPELPVWISEVGAVVSAPRLGIQIDRAAQDAQVRFVVERLSQLPRVVRVNYWHMINLTPGWDSALLEADGSPRPAWYTWCAAAHGNADESCARAPFPLPNVVVPGAELIRGVGAPLWPAP